MTIYKPTFLATPSSQRTEARDATENPFQGTVLASIGQHLHYFDFDQFWTAFDGYSTFVRPSLGRK